MRKNLKKRSVIIMLITLGVALVSTVILVIAVRPLHAEGKLSGGKLHQYEFKNKNYWMWCDDKRAGGCENAIRNLERMQAEIDAIRKRHDEQLKNSGVWI